MMILGRINNHLTCTRKYVRPYTVAKEGMLES